MNEVIIFNFSTDLSLKRPADWRDSLNLHAYPPFSRWATLVRPARSRASRRLRTTSFLVFPISLSSAPTPQ